MQRERGEDIFGESDLPVIAGHGGENAEVDWDGNLVWKWEDIYQNYTITRFTMALQKVLVWVHGIGYFALSVMGLITQGLKVKY